MVLQGIQSVLPCDDSLSIMGVLVRTIFLETRYTTISHFKLHDQQHNTRAKYLLSMSRLLKSVRIARVRRHNMLRHCYYERLCLLYSVACYAFRSTTFVQLKYQVVSTIQKYYVLASRLDHFFRQVVFFEHGRWHGFTPISADALDIF